MLIISPAGNNYVIIKTMTWSYFLLEYSYAIHTKKTNEDHAGDSKVWLGEAVGGIHPFYLFI